MAGREERERERLTVAEWRERLTKGERRQGLTRGDGRQIDIPDSLGISCRQFLGLHWILRVVIIYKLCH